MVGLLDGGLAGVFGAVFGGVYLPATLHRMTPTVTDAGGSVISGGDFVPVECRAQVDATTQGMRAAEGFVDTDQRILVLTASLDGPITTDDEITAAGQRWSIASIARDPAATYWDLRGRAL